MRIHADPDPQPWLGSCSLSIVLIMFQMELEGVTAPGPEDRVIERDGAKVYIQYIHSQLLAAYQRICIFWR